MDERDPEWCQNHNRPGNDGHEQPVEEGTGDDQQPETD